MDTVKINSIVYDGSSKPADFIQQFKLQALFHKWDEVKQLEALPLFLKDKALRAYDGITNKNSIASVLKELQKACEPRKETLLFDFQQRRLQPNETISRFATALHDLLKLAAPSLPEDVADAMLRNQLSWALPDHMRALIQFNNDKSWDQLVLCLENAFPYVIAHAEANAYSPAISNVPTCQMCLSCPS